MATVLEVTRRAAAGSLLLTGPVVRRSRTVTAGRRGRDAGVGWWTSAGARPGTRQQLRTGGRVEAQRGGRY